MHYHFLKLNDGKLRFWSLGPGDRLPNAVIIDGVRIACWKQGSAFFNLLAGSEAIPLETKNTPKRSLTKVTATHVHSGKRSEFHQKQGRRKRSCWSDLGRTVFFQLKQNKTTTTQQQQHNNKQNKSIVQQRTPPFRTFI